MCTICAPKIVGKPYGLFTTSQELGGIKAVHVCHNGKVATSRVLSWHVSREAVVRAGKTVRKAYGMSVRLYPMKVSR